MYFKLSGASLLLLAVAAHAQGLTGSSGDSIKAERPYILDSSSNPLSPEIVKSPAAPLKENWNTLKLEESGLSIRGHGAALLSKIEQPGYTRELLRVQWRPGDPIDLYVIRPRGAAKPPVILYLYNYTSDTDRFRDEGWCKRATAGGFAAVGFVSALSGQRFHAPRPMREWFVSELQEALATSTHDVEMILNYLATRGDLDLSRIGMFGQGSGGAVAILASAADPRISALDVIDPWGDWPEWLKGSRQIPEPERPTYLAPVFLEQVAGLDPLARIAQIHAQAFRLQQVADDPLTPPAASGKLAKAANASALVHYKDEDALKDAWTVKGLSGWLKEKLSAQPANLKNVS